MGFILDDQAKKNPARFTAPGVKVGRLIVPQFPRARSRECREGWLVGLPRRLTGTGRIASTQVACGNRSHGNLGKRASLVLLQPERQLFKNALQPFFEPVHDAGSLTRRD
jgi:hypothetical protein